MIARSWLKPKGFLAWTVPTPNCVWYLMGVWSQLSPQFTKFQTASEIPARFIERNVSLRGKVHGITERGVEVEHLPIHLPVLSRLLTRSKGNDGLPTCTKPQHPKSCSARYFLTAASAAFGQIGSACLPMLLNHDMNHENNRAAYAFIHRVPCQQVECNEPTGSSSPHITCAPIDLKVDSAQHSVSTTATLTLSYFVALLILPPSSCISIL